MSLGVVGTDTGVGKTVVSALILGRYGKPEAPELAGLRQGRRLPQREQDTVLGYWKPVSTGVERDRDAVFIRTRVGDRAEVIDEEYRFNPPVSPHQAARLAGVTIEMERLRSAWQRHSSVQDRTLLVEGIGGVLVPLNDSGDLLADLVAVLRIPVVVVARTALGTINHTLLTLEALRARRIQIAGVVLNGPPSPENLDAIHRFGKADVVGEVSPLPGGQNPSRAAILEAARSFDAKGVLGKYLSREPPRAAANAGNG